MQMHKTSQFETTGDASNRHASADAQATAVQRAAYHFQEFKKASEELDPKITGWIRGEIGDFVRDGPIRFTITAYQKAEVDAAASIDANPGRTPFAAPDLPTLLDRRDEVFAALQAETSAKREALIDQLSALETEILRTPPVSAADAAAKVKLAAIILNDELDGRLASALCQAAAFLDGAGQDPADDVEDEYDAEDLAAMLAEHDATVAWFNRRRAPDWTEEEHQEKEEAIYERAHDLRRAIFQAPADTPEAFAVKLRLAVQLDAEDGRLDDMPGLGDTLRQLLDFLERQGQPAAS